MKEIVDTFQDLIRRSFAPSVAFFVIFFMSYLVIAELLLDYTSASHAVEKSIGWFNKNIAGTEKSALITGIAFLLLLVGASYTIAAINQVIFDNTLKENFNSSFPLFSKGESKQLTTLREQVITRLKKTISEFDSENITYSDYLLYEIIGGIDTADTRGYVNEAKGIGITFTSFILVLLIDLGLFYEHVSGKGIAVTIAIVIFACYLGREAVCAQYRARALRLYVNFLAMPHDKINARRHQ